MTRILQPTQTTLLTYSQIQALVGQPHDPCPHCTSHEFAVTHRGDWICCDCDPGRAFASKGIAIHLLLVDGGDGQLVAANRDEVIRAAKLRSRIQEAGGIVEIVDGEAWAAWVATDGSACYSNADHFGDGRVVGLITNGRVPEVW